MSDRTILGVLRACLAVWGLLWIAAGIVHVGFPEMLPADAAEPLTAGERVVFAAFTIPFGAALAVPPGFFARRFGLFALTLLLALALPVTSLLVAPVTLRGCLSLAALCLFPLLMQSLLVLNARSRSPA
jgi:hypothetical protein